MIARWLTRFSLTFALGLGPNRITTYLCDYCCSYISELGRHVKELKKLQLNLPKEPTIGEVRKLLAKFDTVQLLGSGRCRNFKQWFNGEVDLKNGKYETMKG